MGADASVRHRVTATRVALPEGLGEDERDGLWLGEAGGGDAWLFEVHAVARHSATAQTSMRSVPGIGQSYGGLKDMQRSRVVPVEVKGFGAPAWASSATGPFALSDERSLALYRVGVGCGA